MSLAGGSQEAGCLLQVKRVAGVGVPADSRLVNGLVFRKNVVHKLMRTRIVQPRIMMLGNMLEYHRTTGKLSSFDTLLEQVAAPSMSISLPWHFCIPYSLHSRESDSSCTYCKGSTSSCSERFTMRC